MTYLELEKKLLKVGYILERSGKGSHRIFLHATKPQLTVPCHRGDLKKGTAFNILKIAGIK